MFFMNLAKLTAAGQVTVPAEVRRLLRLRTGDKILFAQNEKGEVVIENASVDAIRKAQMAFSGVAESLGNPDEDTVREWVNEIRYAEGAPK
jgi:AbrB family looped-hinge helix DNA binding protein